jgi:hypothetical protein
MNSGRENSGNRKKTGGNRPKLKFYSRSAFVEKVLYVAIQANAAIVVFNLPFDLSRLAVEYRVGRGGGKRGWSFVLFRYKDKKTGKWRANTFRPRIKLIPKDSKAAFIRLAGGDSESALLPSQPSLSPCSRNVSHPHP